MVVLGREQCVLFVLLGCLLLLVGGARAAALCGGNYSANWPSLNSRPLPAWYDEAKFGIFVHWGVYSVPSWAVPGPFQEQTNPYAEWYWHSLMDNKSATYAFHQRAYPGMRYEDFAPLFRAELWDPTEWARIFATSGAKYVVLTSKHHEGFTLWPSAQSWNWNSWDIGPRRDIVGELSAAVKNAGLTFGLYYSLFEWYNPIYRGPRPSDYVTQVMLPQLYDLVNTYQPSILWGDGCLDYPSSFWQTPAFLSWLYNESPVCENVVVNDRWGNETLWKDGGFFVSELEWPSPDKFGDHKWEDCTGMGYSFGYNRMENASCYQSPTDLITLLVSTVAQGGNLLLDVGPSSDGRIPVVMESTLVKIGEWLRINGDAIYASNKWRVNSELVGNATVWYTASSNQSAVYALVTEWPGAELHLKNVVPSSSSTTVVTLLGFSPNPLKWDYHFAGLTITIPPISNPSQLQAFAVYVFKITYVK